MRTGGITLIELAIVIVVIGGMASLGITSHRGDHDAEVARDCWQATRALVAALELQHRDQPDRPLPFAAASAAALRSGGWLHREPDFRHRREFPWLLLADRTVVCAEHGLVGASMSLSPREQLGARGVTDAGLLARVSDRPVSDTVRAQRHEDRELTAWWIGTAVWFLLSGFLVTTRWETGGVDGPPIAKWLVTAVAALAVVIAYLALGCLEVPEAGPGVKAPPGLASAAVAR